MLLVLIGKLMTNSSMNLTDNEKKIIDFLREAKPYEQITVIKDKDGKPDSYIIQRSQKIILTIKPC